MWLHGGFDWYETVVQSEKEKKILQVDKRWKDQNAHARGEFPVFRATSICVIQPTP